MTTIVLGSTFLPAIARQLQLDLPDCSVREIDLGTRDRPAQDLERYASVLAEADVIVPLRGYVDERVLARAPSCRLIQQFGVGVDGVDLAAAGRRHVPVCNVPSRYGGNADSVAELALFHLIGAGRELRRLQLLVAKEDFAAPFGDSLYGKTVCIVGFGNIGHALARLLRPFGCRVIGIRRRAERKSRSRAVQVWGEARLEEGLALADYVVVCLPLTGSTRSLIGPDQFRAMKRGARIVNVSRGATIDRDALLAALRSGKAAAAGLDVFWEEPVSASDPVLAENVLATPHCAGLTDHMLVGTSRVVAENIRRVVDGRRMRYRVDGA